MKIKMTNKRKQQKGNSARGYISLCLLVLLILCALTGCGGKAGQGASGSDSQQPGQDIEYEEPDDYSWIPEGREWVYLPESILIEAPSADYNSGRIIGNDYYYSYNENTYYENDIGALWCCRYDLSTKELEKVQLEWEWDQEYYDYCGCGSPMRTGTNSMWAHIVLQQWKEEGVLPWDYIALFDENGKLLYSEEREEIREYMKEKGDFLIIKSEVDSKGRLYEFDVNKIMLWEADGTFAGSIPHDDWEDYYSVTPALETEDGKLIELFRWGGNGYSVFTNGKLVEVDFEEKTLTTLMEGENLKEIAGIGKAPDTLAGKTGYYDFVMYDERAVYGYSLADRKKEELFTWKECNMTGRGIRAMGTMPDGRLYAQISDWTSDDNRIAVFTEVSREEAPPMIKMTLATVGKIGEDLNATAMRYNRYNFPYRMEVKSYDSVNDLYNALLTGERIDIVDLSRVKLTVLTSRGLLEDLSPYLERSESEYHREDFVEGILDAYTVDGVLTGIPDSFSIRTVAGDLSRYGGDGGSAGGLTLDAFLTAAEQNPNAKFLEDLDGLTREELMQYLLMFNMEEFVNWETGECRFDSDEFKRVLNCVRNLREPMKDEYAETLLPEKIESGDVLYFVANMDRTQAINLYQELFKKEDVCIGFPTPDGSGGHLLIAQDTFGILATSRHKEGAWKFVESVINHRVKYSGSDLTNLTMAYNMSWNIYPSLQKTLDLFLDNIIERNRKTEEILAGIDRVSYLVFAPAGWDIPSRHLSRDEMLAGPKLVKDAKPYFDAEGDAIIRIVSEEVPAYYSGQKSLDAVAEIIQNRVKLYVMENL